MTDTREAKGVLRDAIAWWRVALNDALRAPMVDGSTADRAWQAVEDAITALNNAAYDRAFQLTGAGEYVRGMQAEIEHLTTERDLARTEFKREATDAGRLARERNEARVALTGERRAVEWALKGRDAARAESVKLLAALGHIEVLTRRGMHDADLLPVLKRAQAEAWKAYRDAQGAVLPIGEDMPEVADEEKGSPRLLRKIVSTLVQRESKLEKALGTLADRYHAQICNRKMKVPVHHRGECEEKPYGVRLAEKALAGESELKVPPAIKLTDVEPYAMPSPLSKADVLMQVDQPQLERRGDHVLFDDRKPKEEPTADDVRKLAREVAGLGSALASDIGDLGGRVKSLEYKSGTRLPSGDSEPSEQPEIEAVLMGTEIKCACGCGAHVQRAQCAYRIGPPTLSMPPLYASKECARRARQPMFPHEPSRGFSAPRPTPPEKPDITKIDVLRACRRFHERGDFAPFVTLAGDFPATVITAKMQAMVAAGLLKYDTNLSTARATLKGRRMLEAADAAEKPLVPPKEPKVVYECSNLLPYGFGVCEWTGSSRDLSPKGRCPQCFHEVRVVEKGQS